MPNTGSRFTEVEDKSFRPLEFQIQGLSCASCVARVTQGVLELDPKANVHVDLISGNTQVTNSGTTSHAIVKKLQNLGFHVPLFKKYFQVRALAAIDLSKSLTDLFSHPHLKASVYDWKWDGNEVLEVRSLHSWGSHSKVVDLAHDYKIQIIDQQQSDNESLKKLNFEKVKVYLSVCIAGLFMVDMFRMSLGEPPYLSVVSQFVLSTIVLSLLGRKFLLGAFHSLKAKLFNMDGLVSISVLSAFVYSVWIMILVLSKGEAHDHQYHLYFETVVLVLAFVSIGKWIEEKSKVRLALQISSSRLTGLETVYKRIRKDWVKVSFSEIIEGDLIRISAGDKVPFDSELVQGAAQFDFSMVSGESKPVPLKSGDLVLQGAINLDGEVGLKVLRDFSNSFQSDLLRSVSQSMHSKFSESPLGDRISTYFVPIVLVIAAFTFAINLSLVGFESSLLRAMAVLVVACPCAIGLALPTVLYRVSALHLSMGAVFKDVSVLHHSQRYEHFVFDKTGTLTQGKPRVTTFATIGSSEFEVLKIVEQLVQYSSHPLSIAMKDYMDHHSARAATYQDETAMTPVESTEDAQVQILPGYGIRGVWGRHAFSLVNRTYLEEKNIRAPDELTTALSATDTTSYLYDEKTESCIAVFQFKDSLRTDARALIQKLKSVGARLTVATGDHAASASEVAHALDLTDVQPDKRPADKVAIIRSIKDEGRRVVMVGDGINDSHAMSAADLSYTFSHATSLAQLSASVVLNSDRLMTIWDSLCLLKSARRKIIQNYTWAFLFNTVMIPFAACGNLSPMWASASMALSSLIVIGNSMLLRGVQNDQL